MKAPKSEPLNFPRLLGKKIDELNREDLAKFKIYPVDLERCAEELITDCCAEVKIFDLKYDAGKVFKLIDPVAFRVFVNDNLMNQIKDDIWIEIDGDIFDKAEIIEQVGLEDEE